MWPRVNGKIKCPVGHIRVWKKGPIPTRRGQKQRYLCTVCGRTFYSDGKKAGHHKARKRGDVVALI